MKTLIELSIVMLAPTILVAAIAELTWFYDGRKVNINNVWRCVVQAFMVIVLLLVATLVVTLIKI